MTNLLQTNSGGNGYTNTEHYIKRVLTGNVASVRQRLSAVLERLDYDFIDDEGEFELQARRNARGWANSYASADVLDYPRALIIKLKPLNEYTTRASFAYFVKHPYLNRGEKDVLTREAETIVKLVTGRATDKICAVCGTESTDDSRFCRKCGAPMTGDETALEVLRMTAEIRSGHTSVVTGAVIAAATALVTLTALLVLIGSGVVIEGVYVLLAVSLVFSLLNVLVTAFGWKRMNNSLKSNYQEPKILSGRTAPTFSDTELSALPPQSSFSIAEGTTELLNGDEEIAAFANRRNDGKKLTGELR